MHTFLVCANVHQISPALLLKRASTITGRLMPALGTELQSVQRLIPEIGGGWFTMAPVVEHRAPLISEWVDAGLAILVYGEMFHSLEKTAAACVAAAWQAGQIDAVRGLDGCFSAVVLDRAEGRVTILSDLIGRRTLRYYCAQDSLFVSVHDVPIVASGACPVVVDPVSVTSILAFDFSLGGASLLEGVQVCQADEYVVWTAGRAQRVLHPVLTLQDRLDATDRTAVDRHMDMMIGQMRGTTRLSCGQAPVVEVDLTAGADSRAVLAILLSVVDSARIQACTVGEGNNVDVRTAQAIATRQRLVHDTVLPKPPSAEDFYTYSRLLAFYMNGDTNSKRAVSNPLPHIERAEPTHLFGGGGEIYRGYFYPSRDVQALRQLSPAQVAQTLAQAYNPGLRGIAWVSSSLRGEVGARLAQLVQRYFDQSPSAADALDLFAVFEDFGRWAALTARGPWWSCYFSPFASPTLVRMAFQLPAPIGIAHSLHQMILKRFLPRGYYWPPINGKHIPALWVFPAMQERVGSVIQHSFLASRRVGRWLNPGRRSDTRGISQVESDFFAQLDGWIQDMLLNDDGLGMRILGTELLSHFVAQDVSRGAGRTKILGGLVTMEQWYTLVTRAQRLAGEAWTS